MSRWTAHLILSEVEGSGPSLGCVPILSYALSRGRRPLRFPFSFSLNQRAAPAAGKEDPRKADRRRPSEGPLVRSNRYDTGSPALSGPSRSASRRLVLDVLLQRLVDLLHREQRRRPRAHQPRGRDGEGEGAGADIVGEVEDDDGVVVAEREVHALELAAKRLERVHDRCPSPRRLVLVQALEPLRGIGGLDHIFGHGLSPSLTVLRSVAELGGCGRRDGA